MFCFKPAAASSPKQLHTNSKPVPDPQRDDSSMVDQVRENLQFAFDCHA